LYIIPPSIYVIKKACLGMPVVKNTGIIGQPFLYDAVKEYSAFTGHYAGPVPTVTGWFSTLHFLRKGERSL
jgi:hypothetical protein